MKPISLTVFDDVQLRRMTLASQNFLLPKLQKHHAMKEGLSNRCPRSLILFFKWVTAYVVQSLIVPPHAVLLKCCVTYGNYRNDT